MSRAGVVRDPEKETCLPALETRLIAKINQGFSEAWWDDYHKLVAKRQEGLLTNGEHRELIRLTDRIESQEAKRLEALVKLAKVRKQTLSKVMTSLGLPGK